MENRQKDTLECEQSGGIVIKEELLIEDVKVEFEEEYIEPHKIMLQKVSKRDSLSPDIKEEVLDSDCTESNIEAENIVVEVEPELYYSNEEHQNEGSVEQNKNLVLRGRPPHELVERTALTLAKQGEHSKPEDRKHVKKTPHPCSFCEKAFKILSHLKRHERTHTKETPYQCSFCPKAFTQLNNLKCHERTHTKETPYQCSFCQRAFKQSTHLKDHERTHTKETPYQCKFCQKAFTQSSTLKYHERTHIKDTS